MKLTEQKLKLLEEIVDKEIDIIYESANAYQEFFKEKLKKYGVKSPSQIPEEKRKKFWEEVKIEWAKKKKEKK
jgi:hypothetical protein